MNETKFPILRECFETGGTLALFPLMKDWSGEKLKSLISEVEAFSKLATEEWKKQTFLPENFFSASRSRSLDRARFEVDSVLSEICSVAYHYLGPMKAPSGVIDFENHKIGVQ